MQPQGSLFRRLGAALFALAVLVSCSSAPTDHSSPPPQVAARAAGRPAAEAGSLRESEAAALDSPATPNPAGYAHDRFGTKPVDIGRDFLAFTLSFDGKDNGECLGVPEWVAYELRATPANLGAAPSRPSRWATDQDLFQQRIAPNDDSYKGSDYSRGHMCMKSHAHRVSDAADTETHTVLNACPQLQGMNNGVWKAIEDLTGEWADLHNRVWIVAGPVFLSRPRTWIGDAGEVPVAVPDAFFKVVVKENGNRVDALAFLVPMEGDASHTKSKADVRPYLTSIDIVESLTGLDLLSALPDPLEADIEKRIFTELWSTKLLTDPIHAEAAPRGPPAGAVATAPTTTATEVQPAPGSAPAAQQPETLSGVAIRPGCQASQSEQLQAKKLRQAGWEYHMPRPKSAQAAWGNRDGRTTWWNGYWHNAAKRAYSSTVPTEADGWRGDGIASNGWRRGGSPPAPTVIEWLCSTSGGILPR